MHAGNGATRGAAFFGAEFALALLGRVFGERNAGISALLRAIMDQAVLADVEVARAGAAAPIVFAARGDVVLEAIDASEGALAERHDLFENFALALAERAELAVAIVQNAHGGSESKLDGAVSDGESVLRVAHAAAENRVDIHLKFGVLGEKLELLVEHLEAFLRDVVGLHVVDADLKIFQARRD